MQDRDKGLNQTCKEENQSEKKVNMMELITEWKLQKNRLMNFKTWRQKVPKMKQGGKERL